MKKTVIFEFPDDFEFPPEFIDKVCYNSKGPRKPAVSCPFYVEADDYGSSYCKITGGDEVDKRPCPFYGGAETVNYNDY